MIVSEGWGVAIFTAILAILTAAVAWLVSRVLGSREDALELRGKLDAMTVKADALTARVAVLEGEHKAFKADALTTEGVRKVMEQALSARDAVAFERRKEWDERLSLKIEASVLNGLQKCEANTKTELERMVPRIVREVLAATPKRS